MDLPVNQIICGDCLEVMRDWPDNCVDLVLTDPPYAMEFDSVWDSLSTSYRILKQGGFLITLCGHYQLPRVMNAMISVGYVWWWISIHLNNNQAICKYAKCCFKPILMFCKGNSRPNRIYCDNFGLRQKTIDWRTSQELHCWGQAVSLFYEPIDAFSFVNGLVLDPFVGSGTVCEAAKRLGRRFIGIDISEKYCEIARMRLKAVDTGVPVQEQKIGQKGLWE